MTRDIGDREMTERAQLTQRIGELIQQVNERDAMIAGLTRDLFEANEALMVFRKFYLRSQGLPTDAPPDMRGNL